MGGSERNLDVGDRVRPRVAPRLDELEDRIRRVRQELALLGDLRPGTLSRQWNVCGNPACRCKADPPRKHGPYYQLSWSRGGKSRTQFVRKEQVRAVREQVRAYERQQRLVNQWTDLALEACRLKSTVRKA